MRLFFLMVGALLSAMVADVLTANPWGPSDPAPKIELRISPETATVRAGGLLRLRVELWNAGTESVIVAQNVNQTFGNSELRLFLEKGQTVDASPGMVADFLPQPYPGFEKTFLSNWLTLDPGHFYG